MKSVLVTGGGRGIGEAISRAFAGKGYLVFVNFNKSEVQAKALAKELGGYAVKADVSNALQVEKMRKLVLGKTRGTLDVLVNNAGDIDWVSSWKGIKEKRWDRVVDTNLKGTFLVTRAFAPAMLKQKKGAIVNLSSTAFFEGKFPAVHYNASKAGVVALTKSFARQFGPSVRVNSVAPGFIQTNFQSKYPPKRLKEILSGIPLGRFGKTEDIAKAVLFLASQEASYVTGQTLVVDGGRIMIP
ncbi:MAG TPA: 3-oxoacyl-ACP reductase family protein [Candidatus Norongarragalinales archaeon]|nr:3-oxoacyl-ACP reductase family protein [Candidatus Norongarragalinales archaeon]